MTFATTREISQQVSFHVRQLTIFHPLSRPRSLIFSTTLSKARYLATSPAYHFHSFFFSLLPLSVSLPPITWNAQGSGRCLPYAGCCERGGRESGKDVQFLDRFPDTHTHTNPRQPHAPPKETPRKEGKERRRKGLISFSVCPHRRKLSPSREVYFRSSCGVRKGSLSVVGGGVERLDDGGRTNVHRSPFHPSRRTLSCSPVCLSALLACSPCLPAHSLTRSPGHRSDSDIPYPASQP